MELGLEITLNVLAVIGMAGVWLIPSNLWRLAVNRRLGQPLSFTSRGIAVASLAGVPCLFGAYGALTVLPRVFRCLWGEACHGDRAGGVILLAIFGISVLVAEVCWVVAAKLWAKWNHAV